MAFNFKKAAQEKTLLSRLMQDREKLETDDVIGKEFTIDAFDLAIKRDPDTGDIITGDGGEIDHFGIVTFAEMPGYYYSVGQVFSEVCKVWAAEFNGDTEKASEELKAQGGVRVRFGTRKSKRGGRSYTSIEIL